MAAMRLTALLLAAILAATASATSLIFYPTCPRLLSYYHLNAVKRASIFARASQPRTVGFARRGGANLASAAPTAFASAPVADATTAAPQEAGVDFSDTNVQVDGVDEPDIIKTDGSRVFVVRRDTLSLVTVANSGTGGKVAATLKLPSSLREMVIEGNTLLLIGSDYGELDPNAKPPPNPPIFPQPFPVLRGGPVALARTTARRVLFPFFGQPITVVYKVTVAGGKLRLLDTLRMQGSYVSAREVKGVVRIVTTYRPRFNFYYPVPIARGAAAPADAAKTIRSSTLDTWLPRYRLARACGSRRSWCLRPRTGYLVGCRSVYHPKGVFSGFGLLTVTTLRMNSALYPRSTSVVSDGRNVYATASSLYVATTVYQNDFLTGPRIGASFSTSFHKFSLGSYSASYAGSGSVTGSVLNQFSMHEYRGIFYVATTVGAPWWGSRDQSKSKVTSFRQSGRTLRSVGSVGNLGVGERIFAVRYVGAIAYVVTFRQIDPLYVLDIKNPARMRVTGELKIPGFSSYLHPIGNGKLLGVGRDATNDGRTTGAKVSLFDVSDVTNPREVSAWTLKGSYSSARWDHRAFLYWAPESVAVLPLNVNGREASERFSGSILLKVSGNSITEKGRISHPKCCGQYASQPSIERNFVLGRTNLWSLSRELLQINDIRSLAVKSNVEI